MITGGGPALLALPTGHRACRQARGEQGAVLSLLRGAHCVQTRDVSTFADIVRRATRIAHREGFSRLGERIVITAGVPFGTPGATNILSIAWVTE